MSRERGSGSNRRVGVFLAPDDLPQLQESLEQDADLEDALEKCNTNCQLIASQADHLQRMRSRCHPASQLTRQEIRIVEEKLIKLFSKQLLEKRRLPSNVSLPPELLSNPSLRQWFEVVGLRKDVVEGLCQDIPDLESLLVKSTSVIKSLLCKHNTDSLEAKKVFRTLDNLKRYIECQELNKNDVGQLYWDSWELSGILSSSSSSFSRPFSSAMTTLTYSVEGEGQDGGNSSGMSSSYTSSSTGVSQRSSDDSNPSSPPVTLSLFAPPSPGPGSYSNSSFTLSHGIGSTPERRYTPPPTPPIIIKGKVISDRRFPPTPPPSKKHLLQNAIKPQLLSQQSPLQQAQDLQQSSLGRSTSHESQLWHRTDVEGGNILSMEQLGSRRSRLHSDSGAETTMSSESSRSPVSIIGFGGDFKDVRNFGLGSCDFSESKIASPTRIPLHHDSGDEEGYKNTLNVPGRTNFLGSMGHNVHHIFVSTLKRTKCDFCQQKFPLSGGLKCKACGYNSHRECKHQIPNSCGLPSEFLELFKKKLLDQSNQMNSRPMGDTLSRGGISTSQPAINNAFHTHDSSSNTSSCNSSSPSSPALILPHSPAHKSAFTYSDNTIRKMYQSEIIPIDMKPLDQFEPKTTPPVSHNSVIDSRLSHDSDKTVSTTTSGSGSTGTDDSERTVAGRVDSQDSTVSESDDPRCIRQNSVTSVSQSLREWDIPYDELVHEKVIGKGRFGTVYSGNWHGQVAIKELHMDYVNDEKTLEAFKAEVSTFRKTRHENLVLFMGACMKPPRLAIVTSLCKGLTLYQHVHIRKDKFTMTRTIHVACQIAQGMGYLHARGIVHKDMKTKNIFLENGRVVITDFGLFNVTRLCYNNRCGDWFSIPPGWLCYLAPEIMRGLHFNPKHDDCLPFTTYSDVYAFGTVWYELLCGEWPYKSLPPEAVIWQVGRGIKPSLAHLQASRDVKDILMACCSYRPDERPEFSTLFEDLEKLPKKRLARSPSHPVQLSRSAESVF